MLRIYLYRRSFTQGMVDPRWAICRNRQICCQGFSFHHSATLCLHAQHKLCPVTSRVLNQFDLSSIQTPVHEKCQCALVWTPFWAAGHVATDTRLQINSLWSSKDAEFHKPTGDINNMPVCHFVKKLFAAVIYVNSRVLCKKRWFSD